MTRGVLIGGRLWHGLAVRPTDRTKMPDFFTAPDGSRLAFDDQNTGKPVLCLAGLTRNMADFDQMALDLPDCRVIRMDYRGRGQSDWTGAATYTIAQEAVDALALMDHLGINRFAILGTSRGGLIAMAISATAKHRLTGVCLNDIGPDLDAGGLAHIADHIGRNPTAKTHAALAAIYPHVHPGFANVSAERWLAETRRRVTETPEGLINRYDPALRDAFVTAINLPPVDLWPFFEAMSGLPIAVVRGENSNLLRAETLAGMRARRPDMITATVPDRGHPPFLDEPESIAALRAWVAALP
jgi:pimeloyl-ACP methyl ester carboxylesterase